MGSCETFSVTIKQREIVTTPLVVPNYWLPMSNLDLLLPPLDVGVFLCYKKSLPRDESVNLVKKSLAQALEMFYPFAGEVVQNSLGEPDLLCNNRGVDFIYAYADVEVMNIDFYHPHNSIERKLIPVKNAGVFSVQVTKLKCGGLVIGCTFDHRVADAYTINMFLVAWAQFTQSKSISIVPSFRRSVLNPRHPPHISSFYNNLYVPLSSLPPPNPCFPVDPLISRIYYVEAKDISHLQCTSSLNENPKRSKLVTKLKCGGLVIGCTFDHRVADAYTINMFLVAWAQFTQSKSISIVPSFRRSVLNPRHPPHISSFYDNLYVPLSSLPPPNPCFPVDPLISRIYYVEAKDISHLQCTSSLNENPKRSKLVSFIAFLWRLMADCEDGSKTCRMGVVVEGRKRLDSLMQSYFGNVLSIPYGQANSEELKKMSLTQVTTMVYDFISVATSEEHFRGLVDWVELHRPEPAVAKIYTKIEESDGDAIVVSSGLRFSLESVDFGWGKQQLGTYHFPWGGQTGYVMPMPSAKMNGDWIVYMYLLQKHLNIVETKGGKIFKPLTPKYLDF